MGKRIVEEYLKNIYISDVEAERNIQIKTNIVIGQTNFSGLLRKVKVLLK